MRNLVPAVALAAVTLAAVTLAAGDAIAQPSGRLALDSAVSVSQFVGEDAVDRPDIIVDVTAALRVGGGWVAYVRPWFRQPGSAPREWATQIYQAALQYERTGPISTRVDLGYILSPIGLGMLDMRPDTNPLIMPHLGYLVPMPSFDAGVPSSLPIASSYPLGGQVTASAAHWDLRAAVVAAPPNRGYVLYASSPNPVSRPTLIVGGGVTPRTGLRLGVGYAAGQYATADELQPPATGARGLHMLSAEGEFAFAYTKISAEVTHDTLDVSSGTATATEWFVQGVQTLTPRWFAAVRHEGANAPVPVWGGARPTLRMTEVAAGYRLSNDFTVRSSFASRKTYFNADASRQVGFSLVWARRWR